MCKKPRMTLCAWSKRCAIPDKADAMETATAKPSVGAQQRIIVNADDLGLSDKVNDAVFAVIEKKRARSATLIANGDAFDAAAARARSYKHCSFGVHLNLTQFKPLAKGMGSGFLLAPDGQFSSQWRSRTFHPSLLSAAYDEFCAQIERMRSALGTISHIDSHHHVHTIPALFPVLAAVVKKYRIRKVRASRNLFGPAEVKSVALMLKKKIWNSALRNGLGVRTTDYFTDLTSFINTAPARQCSVEIMVHPGHDGFASENEVLSDEWWNSIPTRITFINFHEL